MFEVFSDTISEDYSNGLAYYVGPLIASFTNLSHDPPNAYWIWVKFMTQRDADLNKVQHLNNVMLVHEHG